MGPSSRYLVAAGLFIVLAFLASVAGPGYLAYEGSHPVVTRIRVADAPDAMVFITDPHLRPGNLATVREVVRQVNELHPSVVLIGGDFGAGEESDYALQEVWSGLDAPAYAVLGNHDYRAGIDGGGLDGRIAWAAEALFRARGGDTSRYYGDSPDLASADAMEQALEKNGVMVLRNEVVILTLGVKNVTIVGVDDLWAGQADPPEVAGASPVIYLVHEPYADPAWNADLVLSGHTHGGQVNNGVFILLNSLDLVDIQGIHWKGNVPVYVSRGIGTSIFARDYRLFDPPEIVLINPIP
jgi:predicted MPP superfamily phosphohydrolase